MKRDEYSLALLCDFYELTMSRGYFETEMRNKIAYFDVFFRRVPDGGGYAIAAGLEQIVRYIEDLRFTDSDIEYLRGKNKFSEEFLDYLAGFRFNGDIWAVPEGTVIFPGEPILTVRANTIEAQLIETYVLLALNHQSLIATKASRMVRAAKGRPISEFGSRRAHGEDAAVYGARAAYIGGCTGTACTLSDKLYDVPAGGTMAHAWVQMFDNEYEAFTTYCRLYPHNPTLLVDTYSVFGSGIPNAIRAIKDVLWPQGLKECAIRIDSGDIAYLSKKARKTLDEAGLTDCKIIVSNSLDEYIIGELIAQEACVDAFGVGERLITAKSDSVFGCVYKLTAVEDEDGNITPKIKVSENAAKITNPHFKKLFRMYSNETGKAMADLIMLYDETVDQTEPLEIFDPEHTWKRTILENFTAREMLVPVFIEGRLVYDLPPIDEIRDHCAREIATMWKEVLRFENPHGYYIDLSQRLWDLKNEMISKYIKGNKD
ncbi:MAG: nicotinate phosphoribosyltransferase [Clostridia bacterium]|nr:nicotinate phosphoribosyltransferase [Clostridia bacterium]MBQ9995059.1 nicotinate phosphoribosyltransferase [Clostridia bacterium]